MRAVQVPLEDQSMTTSPKWAMYIDGYNFYYAIKNRLPRDQLYLGWCDFSRLAREIIGDRGGVSRIKYFTAPVEGLGRTGGEGGGEEARQAVWLRAVESIRSLEVVRGFHNGDYSDDPSLRHKSRSEKETDVNIAIALVLDAAKHVYDRAILVCGDYDQMPSVRAVAEEFKRPVEVWLPPGQEMGRWHAFDDDKWVSVHSITQPMLQRARLPDTIQHLDGAIQAPTIWRTTNSSPAT